jgi:predicted proteasome-type protease
MFVSKLGLEIETSEKKLTMDKPVEWERVNVFETAETQILIMNAQEKFGITKKVWSNLDKNFWTDKKEALKLKQKEND